VCKHSETSLLLRRFLFWMGSLLIIVGEGTKRRLANEDGDPIACGDESMRLARPAAIELSYAPSDFGPKSVHHLSFCFSYTLRFHSARWLRNASSSSLVQVTQSNANTFSQNVFNSVGVKAPFSRSALCEMTQTFPLT
jgi:hypothetical protein